MFCRFSEKVKEFNELSRIFSEDDNYNSARSILEKEGTAKAAIGVLQPQNGPKDKHQKRMYRHRRTKSEMVSDDLRFWGSEGS